MTKATLELPNGTKVLIEGTPEEVKKLLEFYGGGTPATKPKSKTRRRKRTKQTQSSRTQESNAPDLTEIVNLVKNCDEAEDMEKQILDRTSQVNRILLPLYIVYQYLDNATPLTSGDVSQITSELGVPVQQPNVARTLAGTASKYVMGDTVRKKGKAVRYKLSRRGLKYLSAVIKGSKDGDQE